MVQEFARLVSIPVIAILLIFSLRRILFTFTVLVAHNKNKGKKSIGEYLPDVLILIPCRDEREIISGLCKAILQLDYPRESYQVVLIDDGSMDGTGELMKELAKSRPGWNVLINSDNVGKARALNAALDQFPFGEIVYIFDADHRPDLEVIKCAVRYFADAKIAGVTGMTRVLNPLSSPSAYYSTMESYVNQLITMRAKDRLGLAPALLGSNCGYRRKYLEDCGGFRAGAFSEDSDLTVKFYEAGYQVRFAEDAISYQQVPESAKGYLKQHYRWGRGLFDVAKVHFREILFNRKLTWPLRLELILFAAGYVDRIALTAAGFLSFLSFITRGRINFPSIVIFFALLTPVCQIVALLGKERMHKAMWIRLPIVPIFFALDVLAALQAMLDTWFNRTRTWTRTERVNV